MTKNADGEQSTRKNHFSIQIKVQYASNICQVIVLNVSIITTVYTRKIEFLGVLEPAGFYFPSLNGKEQENTYQHCTV